jgi:hypothetical protein
MLKRRLFGLLAVLVIAGYLVASRADWVTKAARYQGSRNPLFSDSLDLRQSGTVVWQVPPGLTEDALLSLVLNIRSMPEIPRDRTRVALRAKVAAYAMLPDGRREDRLVRDSYFTTDEPFSQQGHSLGESYGLGKMEFTLAGVAVRPGEEVVIELTVQQPDPQLATGHPRLKLVGGSGSPSLDLVLLAMTNDAWFAAALLLLAVLVYQSWRPGGKSQPPEPLPQADPS